MSLGLRKLQRPGALQDAAAFNREQKNEESAERIDHADSVEDLAMGEIFGVERGAAKRLCGCDDGGVPMRHLVTAAEADSRDDEFQRHRKHGH